MKHSLAFILLVYFFSNTAFSKDEWKKYEYPNSKFKIEFPQEAEYSIDTNSIDSVRTFYTHNWSVDDKDSTHPNFSYIITASEFPKDYIHSDSSEAFVDDVLSSTQSSFSENEAFKLDNSSLIEYNGYLGKEYNWTNTEENYYLSIRVYVIQNHLFFIAVFKNDGNKHNSIAKNYLESFETIGIPKGNYSLPKNDEEDTYEISFSDTPKTEIKLLESKIGTLHIKIKTLEKEIDSDSIVFISSEINYKKDVIDKNNPTALNNLYKKSIDGFINSSNGEINSINEVQYNFNLGKEFKGYLMNRAILVSGRIFFINNHFYMQYAMSNPRKDNTKLIKTFLDSFKLKKIKQ